jgi:isoleucyl-tRNA synthetase
VVHSAIKNLQEQARSKKQLGSSLQSFVHIALPSSSGLFHRYLSELPDLFVVSSITLASHADPVPTEITEAEWQYQEAFEVGGLPGTVHVYAPQAGKCPRCWRYAIAEPVAENTICDRCESVVGEEANA